MSEDKELDLRIRWVHPITLGLPDYWLIDRDGRPSVDVLKRQLNIDRASYRIMKVKLEKWLRKFPLTKINGERDYLLDALCDPQVRTHALYLAIGSLSKSGARAVPTRVAYPSWEAVVFHQYHPCFYSKPADGDWKLMFDSLIMESDQPLKESVRKKREASRSLIFPRVLPIWEALTKDLARWNEAEPEQKRLLADVAFGFLTAVGPMALQVCLDIAPGIADFYQFARAYPKNLQGETVVTTDDATAAPDSLLDFYQQLYVKVECGLQAPSDLAIARDIEVFVRTNLPELIAKPVLTESEQVKLVDAFIESILRVGKPLNLRDLAEEEGRSVVMAAWCRHLDAEFRSPVEAGLLIKWHGDIRSRAPELGSGLEVLRAEQEKIAGELKNVDEQLETARFGRRQELEGERQHWANEESRVARTLSEHEARALEALLPEGVSYADLETLSADVVFNPGAFDRSVAAALAAWAEDDARRKGSEEDEGSTAGIPEGETISAPQETDEIATNTEVDENDWTEEEPEHDEHGTDQDHANEVNNDRVDLLHGEARGDLDWVETGSEKPIPGTDEPESIATQAEAVIEVDDEVAATPRSGALTRYQADTEAAAHQYQDAYARRAPDLGVAVENIAFKWLAQGHLNLAFASLKAGQGLDYPIEPTMSPDLFRAAYFGLNVWSREADSLVTCQRLLNPISRQAIDEWSARKPGGKAVSYLVFAATFQPALFGGGFTSASHLLDYIAESLTDPMRKLAKEVVTASHRNLNVSLDSLTRGVSTENKTASQRLVVRLSDWRDRIIGKQTGWAPIRMALTDCLDKAEFKQVITAIGGENGDRAAVQEFVNHYADMSAIQNLLDEQLTKVNPGGAGIAGRSAVSWFAHCVVDLRTLATDWLVENRVRTGGQDGLREFRDRLFTLTKAALDELESLEERAQDLDLQAGIQVARDCIIHLRSAMDGRSESVIWSAARAEAWFRLPEDLMAMEGVPNDGAEQLKWLVEQCGTDFDKRALTEAALQTGKFRVAHLMLLSRKDKGEAVETEFLALEKRRAKYFKTLEDRSNRIQTLIGDALIATLINEEQSYRFGSEIEHIKEEIQRRGGDPFDDLESVEDGLADIEAQLELDYQTKLAAIERDYQEQLRMMHAHLGLDSVSEQWQAVMNKAIESRSLPVAEEMLDQLKSAVKEGVRIGETPRWGNSHLAGFQASADRIYDYIKGQTDPRSFPRKLVQEQGLGLDFGNRAGALKDIAEYLIEWRSSPWTQYGTPQHQQLWKVLEFLGFRQKNGGSKLGLARKLQKGATFVPLTVDTEPAEAGRPFAVFGSSQNDTKLTVVIAFRDWRPDSLRDFLEDQQVIGPRTLLLSAVPMSPEIRNALAKSCKDHQQTLFHADLGLLVYLAAVTQDDSAGAGRRVRDFLMLSAPFTYYNPYLEGDARHPPPPEIRYGRANEINRVLAMPGGSAIIFGGRQLGKTTILHEAQRRFEDPREGRWSWYDQMDEGLVRGGGSSRADWEVARRKVWTTVYNHLVQCKAINPEPGADIDAQIEAVKAEIQQPKPTRFLMVFDEIDRILEVDAVHGFGIFRGLSGLVNQPTARFKLVIAGLENVKRFEDSPNFPLPQLGSSLQVSIMPTLDALQLIREPLEVLGYEFEDELGANRILSAVNRHPGLLQIFAHELLKRLAASHMGPVGTRKITSDDITWVSLNPTVRDQIRNRFNMTLDLDKRYLIIVYSLILAGRASSSFTAAQAKAEAEYWLPGAFAHLTEKQFEAFLGELVGLGVLRPRHAEGRDEFALRSANILNLLGSQADIEHKLADAIKAFEEDDPLGGHAFDAKTLTPSPLSSRDEKQILGLDSLAGPEGKERDFARYSVALITGSKALGLKEVETALPGLYDFDPTARNEGRKFSR